MENLAGKKCVPCEGGVAPLNSEEIKNYLSDLKAGWQVFADSSDGSGEVKKIGKLFEFSGFMKAIEFVNKVADLAEKEGHHPDFEIHYKKVNIILWTHAIGGLSENDFIVAAKIDQIA